MKLFKDLLRLKKVENEFTKEANFILKNMDLVDINMARDLITAAVNKLKTSQDEVKPNLHRNYTNKSLGTSKIKQNTCRSKQGTIDDVGTHKHAYKPMFKELIDSNLNKTHLSTAEYKSMLGIIENRTTEYSIKDHANSLYTSPNISPSKTLKSLKSSSDK